MGSCFLAHGMRYREGSFNHLRSDSISSLNAIAMCCLVIPSILHRLSEAHGTTPSNDLMLTISHGIAIVLLILYILYLTFSLRTHSDVLDPEQYETDSSADSTNAAGLSLGPIAASIWLAVSLTWVTLCTVVVVSSLQVSTWKGKKSFFGFVLFPFLGNLTDYLSACKVALRNNLDMTILVTVGSSMQLLFFTLPALVILGWIIHEPMTLGLHLFETATVFLGVLVVTFVIANGKSNYLCGAMCIAL